jgi:sterol desaturase/sphingolipid hydroxylase (fatty acid hydroxylase superfamily)
MRYSRMLSDKPQTHTAPSTDFGGPLMDDQAFGTRNKRGDFRPSAHREIAPFWAWPAQPGKVLRWLPGYLWPWNLFHVVTALLWWFYVVPDVQTMKTLAVGWPLYLLVVNWAANLAFYGFFEWRYYVRRVQGTRFKFHHQFPGEQASDVFWFKSQNLDNFLRSFLFGVPCWTAVQVILLWAFANGSVAWVGWDEHPVYLLGLMLVAPAVHELHFYVIHRAIHSPWLYKWVHSVHHNSVNPSPWSSLSMHPVEAFIYHAVALWHLLIPSNPIVALFQLHMAGFGAINGHLGFEKLELSDKHAMSSHAYTHYLHHKHFEVNYGGDGLVPLDKWLGTWHDGSPEGDVLMQARYEQKLKRMNNPSA